MTKVERQLQKYMKDLVRKEGRFRVRAGVWDRKKGAWKERFYMLAGSVERGDLKVGFVKEAMIPFLEKYGGGGDRVDFFVLRGEDDVFCGTVSVEGKKVWRRGRG